LRQRSGLGVVPVVLAATTACGGPVGASGARHVEREERRFTVAGRPQVDVSTFDGSIEIRPWDRPEVLVVIEKQAYDEEAAATIEIQAEQDGNRVGVRVTAPKMEFLFGLNWRAASLIVSAPAASDIQARSGDGSITADGITGNVELRSGDGRIDGTNLAGVLRVRTGDGSISLESIDGELVVSTGDGSISAEGRFSGVRAHSGDGRVRIRATPGSVAGDDWDITTGDGSITLELPEGFDGDIDASTGDGRIHLDGVGISGVTGEFDRDHVRGRLGQGGRTVRLRSGDGRIVLRRF
jgi:hypothetical protein